jgi:hypothetical protein
MGAGSYAKHLPGACLVVPQRHLSPFKEFRVHTLTSSPALGIGMDSGTFGCGTYEASAGTQLLPAPMIPNALWSSGHGVYGRTTAAFTMPTYFNTLELNPWKSRPMLNPGDPYNQRASGPAVQQGHMYTMLRRRLRGGVAPHNDSYSGRYDWYFTDANVPLMGQSDWMGFMHPAGCLWTNKGVNEPFLATPYWEDCGQNPVTSDVYNNSFIPFCSPLNTYDSSGDLLGQYIGYTFMFFFAEAYIKYPLPGFKPIDYYSTLPLPPEVTPTYQFFTMDCHLYMVAQPAVGKTLKSPRINSSRYWVYNKDGTTWNIGDQYMYMLLGSMTSNWKFDVNFRLYPSGTETIIFNLTNLRMFVCP